MKHFILILLTISCAVILLLGNQQWKEKVQVKKSSTSAETNAADGEADQEDQEDQTDKLLQYAAKWPAEAQDNFNASLKAGRTYKIVIAGSPALAPEQTGWPAIVKQELEMVYGKAVDVSVKSFDLTSQEFISDGKHEELAAELADLILLEPFILKDNGKVGNDLAAENYSEILNAIAAAKEDAVVILQPANPLSKAIFYPQQVEALKAYAETNGLPYLDHWKAWPETENERRELLDTGDPSYPNEKGHQLWADYIIDYFISK
jgi:hypothetical protein